MKNVSVTVDDVETEKQLCIFGKCEQPIDLSFSNLSYLSSGTKFKEQSRKYILNDLSGKCEPGKLTAILGPSGAGKSSLLNVLSGLRTTGVTGNIMVNGKPRSLHEFRKLSCYIPQQFALLPLLTVRETLIIAADLKFGHTINTFRKGTMVNQILRLLGLLHSSNTLVKYLSGGEKKRLSIGLELLTNPPIMFLDEPTSGLDSTSAMELMLHLKNLAQDNRAIVCVVHQPSSMMFNTFDNVYVLMQGQFIYGGPASEMVSKFAEYGFVCPKYYNPAEFALDIIKDNEEFLKKSESFLPSKKTFIDGVEVRECNSFVPSQKEINYEITADHPNVNILLQCAILLRRAMICSKRDMYLTYFKLSTSFFISILVGALWYDVGNDAEKVLSNLGALFAVMSSAYACNCLLTVMAYPTEAAAVTREHRNNWYSTQAYFFSKLISEIPSQIICATLLVIPLYLMTGQPLETHRIVLFWSVILLVVILGQTHGLAFGTLFPTEMSINILILFAIVFSILSGFPLRKNFMPIWAHWFTYINALTFCFEGMMAAIYGFERESLHCEQPYCYLKSPRKILEEMHMDDYNIEYDVVGLAIWILIYQLLFFIALKWKHRISQ